MGKPTPETPTGADEAVDTPTAEEVAETARTALAEETPAEEESKGTAEAEAFAEAAAPQEPKQETAKPVLDLSALSSKVALAREALEEQRRKEVETMSEELNLLLNTLLQVAEMRAEFGDRAIEVLGDQEEQIKLAAERVEELVRNEYVLIKFMDELAEMVDKLPVKREFKKPLADLTRKAIAAGVLVGEVFEDDIVKLNSLRTPEGKFSDELFKSYVSLKNAIYDKAQRLNDSITGGKGKRSERRGSNGAGKRDTLGAPPKVVTEEDKAAQRADSKKRKRDAKRARKAKRAPKKKEESNGEQAPEAQPEK